MSEPDAEWRDHKLRRRRLVAGHGQPERYDRAAALRLAGITEITDIRNYHAWAYRDEAAFAAYAAVNRDVNGLRVLGPFTGPAGEVVGITDITPAVTRARQGAPPMTLHGHGHVIPNPDGSKARCGGPGICSQCSRELAEKRARIPGRALTEADRAGFLARLAAVWQANPDLRLGQLIANATPPDDITAPVLFYVEDEPFIGRLERFYHDTREEAPDA